MNTFYFTKAKALMCVAACLAGLNMAPAISATTAGAQAADSSAIVHLYNGSNQDCPVIVDGEGQSAYNRSCDYSPDTVLVEKMPSTATLLISDRDCSETTGDGKQQWWVKLQATARTTSTEKLSVQAILSKASAWVGNPSEVTYVAPHLKIVGAGLRSTTSAMNCALLQTPSTTTAGLRTLPGSFTAMDSDRPASCSNGVLLGLYMEGPTRFSYQCASLRDMNDQPFRAYDISNVAVNKADPVQSCPSGKVVTGVVFYRDFEAFHAARLECARFQTTNGQALNIGTQQQQNRWVEYDHHNSICERPANQGPTYLLSSANHFMTGLQIESFKTRWSCSEASFTPH